MSGTTQLSFCSRNSEDGFHSGGSQEDSRHPSFVDQLANDFSNFAILQQKRIAYGQQKCNSDSGASTGELDQIMKEELGAREVKPKMPGSWFYEEQLYPRGDDSSSPTSEADELLLAHLLGTARNVSENVEVPSSEHVAEIVGRQGCKIKALRAKTNTYIKTPVRGEEPVFVVTGKPEDVMEAKREIECAAEHFTQIRASRRHSQGGAPAPGHVTAYVRVPLRVVGLVVGPKGATIKRIQQDTHTYIITPSREREPIFEVTGLPQNVEAARREIEQHIYQRTGNMPITDPSASISNYTDYSAMQLTAAMNAVATRATPFSSLSAPPVPQRRMDPFTGAPEFGRSTENYGFNNLGMMRAYSKPFSPAASPNIFAASSPTPFTPWSNNTMNAAAGSAPPVGYNAPAAPGTFNAFNSEGDIYSRANMLQAASAWSSFGVAANDARDEGLGESPTNTENPYSSVIMSSIWSDVEPRDENKQAVLA